MTDPLRPGEFYFMALVLIVCATLLMESDWSPVAFTLPTLLGVLYLDQH